MSCRRWQIEITAWLDRQLSREEAETLQTHLEGCPDCRRFYREHLEAESILQSAIELRLEPRPQVWAGLRARIAEADSNPGHSWWARHWGFLGIPRPAYAALALMLAAGMFWMLQQRPDALEHRQLAELEAFSLEVEGNPFIVGARFESENPFLPVAFRDDGNPFTQDRGGK